MTMMQLKKKKAKKVNALLFGIVSVAMYASGFFLP